MAPVYSWLVRVATGLIGFYMRAHSLEGKTLEALRTFTPERLREMEVAMQMNMLICASGTLHGCADSQRLERSKAREEEDFEPLE